MSTPGSAESGAGAPGVPGPSQVDVPGVPLDAAALAELATGRRESLFAGDMQRADGLLDASFRDRRLLVVGGAGSIGAACVRRLLGFRPAAIDVIDRDENQLAELARRVRAHGGAALEGVALRFAPVDYTGPQATRVMAESDGYDRILVFAAMKHVRSEKSASSILEMLRINVTGLRALLQNLSRIAPDAPVFSVSTDKAANPTSVMGASKRLMEAVLFQTASQPTTAARFANVAFSQGSLPASFLTRMTRGEPLVAPRSTRRYFVSEAESAEICLLAAVCPPAGAVAYPALDPAAHLVTLESVASRFLRRLGYEPELFDEPTAAIEAVSSLRSRGRWPLLLTPLDTSGEKPFEEFLGAGDVPVPLDLDAVAALRPAPLDGLEALLDAVEALHGDPSRPADRNELIASMQRVVGTFEHVRGSAALDDRL